MEQINAVEEKLDFDDESFPVSAIFSKYCLQTQPMRHPSLEIKYITHGSCTIICDDNTIIAKEGDAVIISPFQSHYTFSSEGICQYHLLDLDLSFLSSVLLNSIDLDCLIPLRDGRLVLKHLLHEGEAGNAEVAALFDTLSHRGAAHELMVKSAMLRLLGVLIESGSFTRTDEKLNKKLKRYDDALRPAFQYIYKHYGEKITPDQLARTCNFNVKYFCKIFKQYTEQTVLEYVNGYRLQKAELDMLYTDMSLSEIAEANGFGDIAHFSHYYKKMRGFPPSHMREGCSPPS